MPNLMKTWNQAGPSFVQHSLFASHHFNRLSFPENDAHVMSSQSHMATCPDASRGFHVVRNHMNSASFNSSYYIIYMMILSSHICYMTLS